MQTLSEHARSSAKRLHKRIATYNWTMSSGIQGTHLISFFKSKISNCTRCIVDSIVVQYAKQSFTTGHDEVSAPTEVDIPMMRKTCVALEPQEFGAHLGNPSTHMAPSRGLDAKVLHKNSLR